MKKVYEHEEYYETYVNNVEPEIDDEVYDTVVKRQSSMVFRFTQQCRVELGRELDEKG